MSTKIAFSMICILFSVALFSCGEDKTMVECPEIDGYAEANFITPDQAEGLAWQYARLHNDSVIRGGIITAGWIDSLLADYGTTGIAYYLVLDSTGEYGPANMPFIAVAGVAVTTRSDGSVRSAKRLGGDLVIPNNWCPPTCAPLK